MVSAWRRFPFERGWIVVLSESVRSCSLFSTRTHTPRLFSSTVDSTLSAICIYICIYICTVDGTLSTVDGTLSAKMSVTFHISDVDVEATSLKPLLSCRWTWEKRPRHQILDPFSHMDGYSISVRRCFKTSTHWEGILIQWLLFKFCKFCRGVIHRIRVPCTCCFQSMSIITALSFETSLADHLLETLSCTKK